MSGSASRSVEPHVVTKKRLDYAARACRDIEAIEAYYLEEAGETIADRAVDAILTQAEKIAALDLKFRPGIRAGTRECVMTRFPYTLVYLSRAREVKIVRVLHQRSEYFNRLAAPRRPA
jgi:plasmid stabilization system protein ParE